MKRRILAVLAMAFLVWGDESLVPLKEGTTWSYAVTTKVSTMGIETTTPMTASMTCRRDATGYLLLTEYSDGQRGQLQLTCNGERLEVLSASGAVLPLLPTHRGERKVAINQTNVAPAQCERGALESVTTPAGSYEACPVTTSTKGPEGETQVTVWYAPGVGAVKTQEIVRQAGATVTRIHELSAVPSPAPPSGSKTNLQDASPWGKLETLELVRRATETNTDKAVFDELARRLATLLDEAERAGQKRVALQWPPHSQVSRGSPVERLGAVKSQAIAASGFSAAGSVDACAVYSLDEVDVAGSAKGSLFIVFGDLEILGNVEDCVIVCTGSLEIGGRVSQSVILARSDAEVGGILDKTLVAAEELDAGSMKSSIRADAAVSKKLWTVFP